MYVLLSYVYDIKSLYAGCLIVGGWARTCSGTIAETPKGERAFGWDPVFIPKGYAIPWAEMDFETQSKTSMRRLAIEKLQVYLEANYK